MTTKVTVIDSMGSTSYEVQESVADVSNEVNVALSSNLKFITFTGTDGKEFSVAASEVTDIREV